jgi:predicted TIM-barrel fold metal-dependent hydrolase
MKALVISIMLMGAVGAFGGHLNETAAPRALFEIASADPVSGSFSPEELRAFAALNPIDTHVHVRRVDPTFDAMLNRLNVHLIDIILVDAQTPEEEDLQLKKKVVSDFIRSSRRAVLCTSIDPYKMHEPDFQATTIRMLNDDFDHGAIAVKIWKNIGMEIKDGRGNYVLPDDPAFAPLYKNIAAHNKTLVAHIADPDSAWAPPNPASPDYSYYSKNPKWFMYGRPNPPSKEQILRARDHILELNPNLRVVGAHLGSMEADLHQLAQRLDRYPNFAVDMAARMPYFALQPRAEMIAFILKYQDRLIYATDLSFNVEDHLEARMNFWELSYARDWRFLATTDLVEFEGAKGQGLALPEPVLRKIYHDNAVRWFPGIVKGFTLGGTALVDPR